MPDEEGYLTPDELKKRWEVTPGIEFRNKIIEQLKSEETGHRVDWENLEVTVGKIPYLWKDFTGVNELIEKYNVARIYDAHLRDLRGVNFAGELLINALLGHAHLENANLEDANLDRASLGNAHLENANFWGTNLDHANLNGAHLENANFWGTNLDHARLNRANLEHARLNSAHLDHAELESAHLDHAELRGAILKNANLEDANLKNADLRDANLGHANLMSANLGNADLSGSTFLFKSFWWRFREIWWRSGGNWWYSGGNWWHFRGTLEKKLRKAPDRPTIIHGAALKNVKLDAEPVLYRELLDEQYLDDFAEKHKFLYFFWLVSSNCGRNVRPVFLWTILIGILFGFVFADINSPVWMQNYTYSRDVANILDWADPHFQYNNAPQTRLWQPFYLSFVTMTTLGVASAEPANGAAYWWHTGQNLLGYMMLGYLIAVLGSKFTRRSA